MPTLDELRALRLRYERYRAKSMTDVLGNEWVHADIADELIAAQQQRIAVLEKALADTIRHGYAEYRRVPGVHTASIEEWGGAAYDLLNADAGGK